MLEHIRTTMPRAAAAAAALLQCAALARAGAPAAGGGGPALRLNGDTPWVVPPELAKPSEATSDALEDTAQTLVRARCSPRKTPPAAHDCE